MFSKSIIDEIFTGEFDIVSYTVILNINRIKWIDLDNDLSFFIIEWEQFHIWLKRTSMFETKWFIYDIRFLIFSEMYHECFIVGQTSVGVALFVREIAIYGDLYCRVLW